MISEMVLKLLAVVVAGSLGVRGEGRDVTDAEYAQFPRLFHLDDYPSCLARPAALYCLGTFELMPDKEPDPVYQAMVDYSNDRNNFNHTLIHRGYCVSGRCGAGGGERNASLRFERCAAQWGRARSLRVALQRLHYCRTHAQHYAATHGQEPVDLAHRVFLAFVCLLLLINVLATVYDVTIRDEHKKCKLVTAWSVRANWQRLVGPFPDGDPRLAALLPVEAGRVLMMLLVVFTHSGVIHNMLFQQNPRDVEVMSKHPVLMLLRNGTSAVQIFILLSSFLLAQSLLHHPQQPPSFTLLPKLVLKRIVRIAPVYLLVVGFAATWWPRLRVGPMWPMAVAAESEVCRRKFWAHALFIQNFVDSTEHCQIQTWFVAVDMQLYVCACALTLALARARRGALGARGALGTLAGLFAAACALNGYRAYANGWIPFMHISVPEMMRTSFREAASFSEFYTTPLGSLPSCLLGLFLAHLQHELHDRGFKPADHKWLIIGCQMTVPLLPAWTSSGHLMRHWRSREFLALFVALERPVLALLAAVLLFGAYNGVSKKEINAVTPVKTDKENVVSKSPTKGFLKYVFCWRVWYPLGRLSLSVLMLHWCVNLFLVASTLTPITSTTLDMVSHFLATACCSYLLAAPVALLLELPAQRFYSALTC